VKVGVPASREEMYVIVFADFISGDAKGRFESRG
jgi:hypothetical protein